MPTALVTGASAGLGVDFCHILAEQGHDLILTARAEDRLKSLGSALESKHKINCTVIPCDLAQIQGAQSLYDQIKVRNLAVDILVNNAGFGVYGDLVTNPVHSIEELIRLNISALTTLTRLFLSHMIEHRSGYILNVASTAAFQPGPHMAVYYASKAYVLSFTEAVAHEARGTGVTITALCPGPTKTEFFERANMSGSRLKSMMTATSRSCAEHGIREMFSGKVVVIDGKINQILSFLLRFIPRNLVRIFSGFISGSSQ